MVDLAGPHIEFRGDSRFVAELICHQRRQKLRGATAGPDWSQFLLKITHQRNNAASGAQCLRAAIPIAYASACPPQHLTMGAETERTDDDRCLTSND